ncbi:MAG: hypothetical protein AAF387_13240 [Pseudomonadota bacterium]
MSQAKRTNGAAEAADADNQTEGNVDKIRDILFGGQMRDYERRFEKLEAEFQRKMSQLENDFKAKIESLDTQAKREIDKLTKKATQEKKERTAALTELSGSLSAMGARLEERLVELDDGLAGESSEIRRDLENTRVEVMDETSRLVTEVTELMRVENDSLQDTKADRVELAGLFSEFAMRLNREFDLPDE